MNLKNISNLAEFFLIFSAILIILWIRFPGFSPEVASQQVVSALPWPAAHHWVLGKKVSLNQATFKDIMQIPTIGPSRAQSIIQKRKEQGLFYQWQEVVSVQGVGPKTLELLKKYFYIHPAD